MNEGIKAITAKIRTNTQDDTCITTDVAHNCDLIDEQVDGGPLSDGVKAITAKIRTNTQNDTCVTADVAGNCDLIDEQADNESA